ncbi:MAG: amidohydrolase family protein [Marinicellaceae bacterium]
MKNIFILILLFVTSSIYALTPTPGVKQAGEVVYHNAMVHVGNGKVLENATIAFKDGKITRVGYFKMKWQESDINLNGKHVYPGFILPSTNLGISEINSIKATRDSNEVGQMNPNVRSIVAYNTDSEITPTLRFNGILLAQTTPQGGLLSGLSSVVQLDAWNWDDAAVLIDDAIHVNWPSIKRSSFDYSTYTMKYEKNKNYEKQRAQITSLFEDAKLGVHRQNGKVNLKLDAISPAFEGTRKVFIHTNDPKAIVESINYFQEVGVKQLVLVAQQGALPVTGFIKDSGVPVIVSSTHAQPKRDDSSVDAGYTTAIKLHNLGILTALGYRGAMSSRNLAFTAGTLVGYGMDKEQALKLITSNTAKILGIDKDYGTLETGKSATLIITDGDALDMRGNQLEAAYIDGRKLNLDGRQQALEKRFLEKYNLNK